jgi:glyoxalase-like protein
MYHMTDAISRRAFLTAAAALLAPRISRPAEAAQVPKLLDHILLGCDDLDRGIAYVEVRTGVRAKFGGVHPGAGTQNALLSLGPHRYLEIIAPDPKQPDAADTRGLKSLVNDPALVGWAAHPGEISALAAGLKQRNFEIEGPMPGSRKRPDGRVLNWTVLRLKNESTQLLPFFIEWGAGSIHPSVDSPQGCQLLRFEAVTPDVVRLSAMAKELKLDLPIIPGKKMYLRAVIEGPRGKFEVTS